MIALISSVIITITILAVALATPFLTNKSLLTNSSSSTVPIKEMSAINQPSKNINYNTNINITAESAIIYDVNSGKILYAKNENQARPIASLAKLMTALVVMDENKPDEIIEVGDIPELGLFDQKIGIKKGEKFKTIDLLKALLINSANDSANALAIDSSGSIEDFASKMNKKASEWGLNSTKFKNPSGLDQSDSFSSASDILKIALILNESKTFNEIEGTNRDSIFSSQGNKYEFVTTNNILGTNNVVGGKTGYTLNAGPCLITTAEKNGNKIMTVVLNSENRFQETINMIEWAFNNHTWQ